MIQFLSGPIIKLIGGSLVALCLMGGATYAVHQYNSLIEARGEVAMQTFRIEVMQRDHDRTVAALEQSAAEASARATTMQATRKAIANAPDTKGCATSGAVAAAVAGLRAGSAARGAGAAPSRPSEPYDVLSAARAATGAAIRPSPSWLDR